MSSKALGGVPNPGWSGVHPRRKPPFPESIYEKKTASSNYYLCVNVAVMDDVLAIEDPEAGPWLKQHQPRLHLLLGDSIARDANLDTTVARDAFLRLARGGETWASLLQRLERHLDSWRQEAADQGRQLGAAVVWMTGNEVYSRRSGLASFGLDSLAEIGESVRGVLKELSGVTEELVVLGPLARPLGEVIGIGWSRTAAFHLERRAGPRLTC